MQKSVIIFDGMIEHEDDGMTLSGISINEEQVEGYVGTWYMAVTVRYGKVTFQRREHEGVYAYVATVKEFGSDTIVVATLTIVSNGLDLRNYAL